MKAYDVAIKSAFSLHKIKLTLLSYFAFSYFERRSKYGAVGI